MLMKVSMSSPKGKVRIPGSKSHTIRALFLASLAEGRSEIIQPLISNDALSAVKICQAMGAQIDRKEDRFIVQGFGGKPLVPEDVIDVGNSGTSLWFGITAAALCEGHTVFTGDHQIRRRPMGPLLEAVNALGGSAVSTRSNGLAPIMIQGRMKGGRTAVDAVVSQFLSSLLVAAPLLENDTRIEVSRLNEAPYVGMTLWWLDKQGIQYENNNYKSFHIRGGQGYKPFQASIPGDFSSATFFMVLSAVSGEEFILDNLDISDTQGDKAVLYMLESMGARINVCENAISIKGDKLVGREIDLNATPDALPAMAVAGCFAEGETRLVNVPQARMKETDRIRVMCEELGRMGADIEELPDGLIIRQSKLKGCRVNGHYDHRVVMALAVAGLNIEGETIIETAEAMSITFPEFARFIRDCGGEIELSSLF
jgi:3-phosphoshikimate 1-carboxyvinyltransferase